MQRGGTWGLAVLLTIMAIRGYWDVAPAIRPVYPFMAAALIYSQFARAGMFSFLDVIGWISSLSHQFHRRPPAPVLRIPGIKIPADQSRPLGPRKIGVVLAGGGGK